MAIVLRELPARSPLARPGTSENATLVGRHAVTEDMARFTIELDEPVSGFESGQYVSLGLRDGDRFVQRPYSICTAPGRQRHLEFFIRRVNGGALTPGLWSVRLGSRLLAGPPKGLFKLLPGDRRAHLFVATGTGLAPFLSMLGAGAGSASGARVVMLHGVSFRAELGYERQLRQVAHSSGSLVYEPAISRPDHPWNAGWAGRQGRVPAVLGDVCAANGIEPGASVVYLCGNPDMIEACETILLERGFPREGIRAEHYQPAVRRVA